MNVVKFDEFRQLKEIRRNEEAYNRYLKSLGNSQLEGEINSLLEEFSQDSFDLNFFSRGRLILKEISFRAHGQVKVRIDKLTDKSFSKI
jgi:hypothetical protein